MALEAGAGVGRNADDFYFEIKTKSCSLFDVAWPPAEAADVFICSGNECTPIHTDCFHVM